MPLRSLASPLLLGLTLSLSSCSAAQGAALESALTKAGCALVAVLAHDEQVGTLCDDIAPAVEAEIAALVAEGQGGRGPGTRAPAP